MQDLKYGFRMLAKNPGFTAIAVLTLALGIGATTAIFSVVDAVLLRPLPFSHSEQLVSLWETIARTKADQMSVTGPNYLAWAEQNHVFSNLAAGAIYDPALTGVGEPEHLFGIKVTPNFFKVLGVQPGMGRAFLPEEGKGPQAHVVILGYDFWQRKFGGSRSIVGEAITLDGEKFTVVGIMPGTFRFPQIWGITGPYSYVPFTNQELAEPNHGNRLWVIGRMKPGVTLGQARAEMATIAQRLASEDPKTDKGVGVNVQTLHEEVEQGDGWPLVTLLIAVGFMLLIACVNVANMLLGRATRRRREMAVRLAVGAHRWRILRQLLTESTLLALLGCVPGVLLASWMKEWLIMLSPQGSIPQTNPINLNLGVLAFVAAVAVGTGILFGLAPAFQASRTNIEESLKEGVRTSAGTGSNRLRKTLVASEVALTMVLLIGTGLMIRSLEFLFNQRMGFNLKNVLTLNMNLPDTRYGKPGQPLAFDRSVLQRVEALPGVKSAAFTTILPMWRGGGGGVKLEGQPDTAEPKGGANAGFVTPGYFRTLVIPLVRGRLFTDADCTGRPEVAVIDRKFAQTFWPKQDPIGKRFQLDFGPDFEHRWYAVVGVVGAVTEDPGSPAQPTVYLPAASADGLLVVRTAVKPSGLTKAVEAQVWKVDKDLPIYDVATMEQIHSRMYGAFSYMNALMGIFSFISLALAAVGIYAVLAYLAGERTHEFGIRMALGAQKSDVLKLVVAQGLKLVVIGVAIGIAGALALTRFLASLLYGVKPTDPLTFIAVSLILTAVALLACYIPARRAAKVDPMVALRYE
jgi:putative ABC transport system permease protein